jgi:hypothetical protein
MKPMTPLYDIVGLMTLIEKAIAKAEGRNG